jgi:signal transduction histidine kinase
MKPYLDIQLDKITQSLQTQILTTSDGGLQTEKLLTASAVLDALAVGVIVTNQAGLITYVNTRGEDLMERTRHQLYGEPALSVKLFGPDVVCAQKARARLLQDNQLEGQINIFTPQGVRKSVKYYASVLRNTQGQVLNVIASLIEYQGNPQLNEQFRDQQLEELQAQTEAALQNTTKAVWFVDRNSRLLKYNRVFEKSFQREIGMKLKPGIKFEQLLPPAYHQRWQQLQEKALQGESFSHKESLLMNGKKIVFAVSISPGKDTSGKVSSICYASRRLQQDAPQMDMIKQQSYTQGVADERKRVGMELHDGIGQRITALQMRLNVLIARDQCDPGHFEQLRQEIADIQEEIRRISHNMMPLPLERYNIEDALLLLLRDTEELEKIKINFYAKLSQVKYPVNVEKNLYYIVQELLQNTAKHAKNQQVYLNISEESGVLNVIYRNNISFVVNSDTNKSNGRGLLSIRERVSRLGGTLRIENSHKSGFQIIIKLHL